MGTAPLLLSPTPTSPHTLGTGLRVTPCPPGHILLFLPGMDWIVRWTPGAQLCLGELEMDQSDRKGRGHQEENGLKSALGARS